MIDPVADCQRQLNFDPLAVAPTGAVEWVTMLTDNVVTPFVALHVNLDKMDELRKETVTA
jgi:hypothetical protein